MVANMNIEELPLEMERLKTSIKYHDWFLGFVVVVGVSLTIYLVGSMNKLNDSVHEVHRELMKVHTKIELLDQKVNALDQKVNALDQKVNRLEQKMDSYHGGSGNLSS